MHTCDPINAVAHAIHDAAFRLGRPIHQTRAFGVLLWQQSWPSTACGFGDTGGAAKAETYLRTKGQA